LAHHERGPEIFANDRAWDYVQGCMARYQTVVTVVVSNRQRVDGLEVAVQVRQREIKEEQEYLKHTAQESYEQMAQVKDRLLKLLHHVAHVKGYRKS
jgi:protein-arginine kinase activator protein McsA